MHYFVTGGAGFIGSNMIDRLLANGKMVTAYDNFSTGFKEFLKDANKNENFTLIEGDLLDFDYLKKSMNGMQMVYHFAANADVRFGTEHPEKDIQQNTIATFNVLEAMRANSISKIAFSSTGSIYGEPKTFPTAENAPFPTQTSLYGASKLACEGLISAYCEGFGMRGTSFRFVSVLGERYTHGHIFDFCKKLINDPNQLEILGNGKQRKSYMYVQDCIDAMLLVEANKGSGYDVFNLGYDGFIEVNQSVDWITQVMGISPTRKYTGGERGWIGDSPFIYLDTKKIQAFSWKPKLTIQQGVERTVNWLLENRWALERNT
jgi:UDP-glucose 4-epimerase